MKSSISRKAYSRAVCAVMLLASAAGCGDGTVDSVEPGGQKLLTAGRGAPAAGPDAADLAALIQQGKAKPNQLLVKYRTAEQAARPSASLTALKVQANRGFYRPSKALKSAADEIGRWRLVSFADSQTTTEAFKALRNDPSVEYVAPNVVYHLLARPNDLSADDWGLDNTGQTVQSSVGKADADIDAPEAWAIRSDASNVVVAVIDTGIDYTHPDLAANIWTNPGEIPGNGLDDDGNGYVDDVHGYDFADHDSDPMDTHSHGTHVAGTIGAVGNNGQGVTGVAWKAKLMAVKVFGGGSGDAYASDIVNGILYAADMGAKVSNNSWGVSSSDHVLPNLVGRPLREAIKYADDAGMLFVAAAGNNYRTLDDQTFNTPSGFDVPNVVSVAATDNTDTLAEFSNHSSGPGARLGTRRAGCVRLDMSAAPPPTGRGTVRCCGACSFLRLGEA
ncbi:MAG: S8 family peptidase [Myxococcaceae bacterium]